MEVNSITDESYSTVPNNHTPTKSDQKSKFLYSRVPNNRVSQINVFNENSCWTQGRVVA